MPTQTVLSTYELFERILLHLPLRSLLLAQRVNKACFDVISASPDIQRAIFIKPSAPPVHEFELQEEDGEWSTTWQRTEDSDAFKPILNPFLPVCCIDLLRARNVAPDIEHALRNTSSTLFGLQDNPVSGFACRRKQVDTPYTMYSRDRMLLTHPPVGTLIFEDFGTGDGNTSAAGNERGTSYGDLEQYGATHRGHSFYTLRRSPRRAVYDFDQAMTWKPLARGVDNITGFEMLEIMRTRPEELGDELLFDGDSDDDDDSEDGSEGNSEDDSDVTMATDEEDDDASDDEESSESEAGDEERSGILCDLRR